MSECADDLNELCAFIPERLAPACGIPRRYHDGVTTHTFTLPSKVPLLGFLPEWLDEDA